jgi:ferredoxin
VVTSGGGVRVKVHPGLCHGYGNCHRFASAVFTLDAEGYIDVHLMDVPAELVEAARLGAGVCPEGAITVIELPTGARTSGPGTELPVAE